MQDLLDMVPLTRMHKERTDKLLHRLRTVRSGKATWSAFSWEVICERLDEVAIFIAERDVEAICTYAHIVAIAVLYLCEKPDRKRARALRDKMARHIVELHIAAGHTDDSELSMEDQRSIFVSMQACFVLVALLMTKYPDTL